MRQAADASVRVSALRVYGAFVRAAFLKMLAYRLRYLTGIFSYLIYVTTYYYLWRSVYAHAGPGRIAGLDLGEMVTYVAVGWIARSFYFNNVDRDLADLVAAGDIASLLARPVSLQGMMVAQSLGESLFRLLFFSLPIFWVAVLLKQYGAIQLNNWLADPTISVPVIIGVSVIAALIWMSLIGGRWRRRLIGGLGRPSAAAPFWPQPHRPLGTGQRADRADRRRCHARAPRRAADRFQPRRLAGRLPPTPSVGVDRRLRRGWTRSRLHPADSILPPRLPRAPAG